MHSIIVALAALIASASHDTPDIDLGDQQFFQLYSRERVQQCRMAALNHLCAVNGRFAIAETDEEALFAWRASARYCYEVWNLLDDVQIYTADPTNYAAAEIAMWKLSALRDMIGLANYYSGKMPDPIPVWHLPRID